MQVRDIYAAHEAGGLATVARTRPAVDELLRQVAIFGSAAAAAFAVLSALSHDSPDSIGVFVAFLFAACLSIVSVALARLLTTLGRADSWAMLSAGSNIIAGALFVAMVLVQVAVRDVADPPDESARAVFWGLDVAWDLYLAAATLGFAVAFLRVPWFRWWALPGIVVVLAFVALNLASFPEPPSSAGLIDLGPAIGLWYFTVAVRCVFILRRSNQPPTE